ncbi:MAG: chromosomal replication initiator protein DnaA [Phycisphaerae bacterium]
MGTVAESVCAGEDTEQRVLAALQARVGPRKFNAWFKHAARVNVEDGRVKLSVPNSFVANWIETHYHDDIAAVAEELDCDGSVLVTVDPDLNGRVRKRQLDMQADIVSRTAEGRTRPAPGHREARTLRHKFDTFVVGECNKLAYSAAVMMAGASRPAFNPLFVHGPCGIGKTHLLQGVCNAFSKLRRGGGPLAWRYVTAEEFTNEYITALRRKKIDEFRARYRRLDLLAIDDVHFLSAKKATQDEFLHTFNAIESSGRRVVMASDAHPKLVGDLNEQLVSRFLAGMVVRMEPPELATRMEILRRNARRMKLHVPTDVLEYIAMHVRGSVRELEGTLIKLGALASVSGGPITAQTASEALADHLARTGSTRTVDDIEAVVSSFFGVSPADIHSSRRTKTVSAARMVAMYLSRRHTQMSYPEIGRHMGKNHSSVVLAVQKMEKLLAEGGELAWRTPDGSKSMPAGELLQRLSEQFT